jgi:hypothetical protein
MEFGWSEKHKLGTMLTDSDTQGKAFRHVDDYHMNSVTG